MGSMLGESVWAAANEAVARANNVWHSSPHSALALIAIIIFYTLFGTRLDLLFNIAVLVLFNHSALYPYLPSALQFGLLSCFSVIVVLMGFLLLPFRKTHATAWHGPGQSYLIPCRTTHSRLFPVKHSFSYSYLTVGIAVGYKGSVNRMIGVDEHSCSPVWSKVPFGKLFTRSWFSIRASDYLQRGLNPNAFPHAYLVTAPRFAGYSFNPVSFWYLYTPHKTLSAMILEVNNTYDERRPYLVLRQLSSDTKTPAERVRIEGSRVKDFYVSPFNSRKGHYSVLLSDPLGLGMNGFRSIDVKITLKSSTGHPKLVARLVSEGPAVDPAALGVFSKLAFLAKWCWVGLATVPKIVMEAVVLLYRRNLHMKHKPEPLIGTLGRHATSVEKTLEGCFRQYLEFLVHNSRTPVSLNYFTSGFLSEAEVIFTSQHDVDSQGYEQLELRVLTPAFYSRLIQYRDSLDGIISELKEHRTVWMNKPELLPVIFCPSLFTRLKPRSMSFSDFLFSALVKKLRRPPEASLDSESVHMPRSILLPDNIESADVSSLEEYMMWATFRQLIADRLFMSRVDWLELGIFAARQRQIAWTRSR
ncbi:hypothetical protein DL98DRAFT_546643 [Cadophora sp. DSE1049]|nr:hypothetical protein DL98DRAFT_546643 [Cadophora sp. DSE1049]